MRSPADIVSAVLTLRTSPDVTVLCKEGENGRRSAVSEGTRCRRPPKTNLPLTVQASRDVGGCSLPLLQVQQSLSEAKSSSLNGNSWVAKRS